MNVRKITFTSDNQSLSGKLIIPKVHKNTGVLILHGGGKSNKERFLKLQEFLVINDYTSLPFNFRGVGESTGKYEEGSLINRLHDAESAYDELSKYVDQIILIGCSMGGHVATMLTETRDIHKLILLYMATYAKEAEDKPLNEEFTEILRTEN